MCVVSDRNSGALNGLSSSENADAKNLRVKVRAFVFNLKLLFKNVWTDLNAVSFVRRFWRG